ncbi:MAG: transporter permease [Chloroflexi bacterium]|jgi:sulfonate transport system permease protein|nr:transporter permease [Chloroflexota bacterium]
MLQNSPVLDKELPPITTSITDTPGTPAKRPGFLGRLNPIAGLVLPGLLLVLWWYIAEVAHLLPVNQLPTPGRVWNTGLQLFNSGELFRHLTTSLGRVLTGFVIGSAIALVLGTLVGLLRPVEKFLDPFLQALRNVPSLAWVPFLLLWMGIDEPPKITLIAIGAFFPVYLNLVSGIRQTDRKLVEVGYIFGLKQFELIYKIVLPAALPYLLAGLRIGLGQSWLFLVAAELIASTRGLGFMLIDGENSSRPDIMLVAIITLALVGKLCDWGLQLVEKRLLRWTDTFKGR